MEALRKIVRSSTTQYNLTLPEWAVGRDVEVIVLPVAVAENQLGNKKPVPRENMGPLSVLGYVKKFRTTRATDEWMQDLRKEDARKTP